MEKANLTPSTGNLKQHAERAGVRDRVVVAWAGDRCASYVLDLTTRDTSIFPFYNRTLLNAPNQSGKKKNRFLIGMERFTMLGL